MFSARPGSPFLPMRARSTPPMEARSPSAPKQKIRSTMPKGSAMTMAAAKEATLESKRSAPMPATSPTLSPTLSAMTAGFLGSSSGMPSSTLPAKSAAMSAVLVKMPPPALAKSARELAPKPIIITPEAAPFLSGKRATTEDMTVLYTTPTPRLETAKAMYKSQSRSDVSREQRKKPAAPITPPMGRERPAPSFFVRALPSTPPRQKPAIITVKQSPSSALVQPKSSGKGEE